MDAEHLVQGSEDEKGYGIPGVSMRAGGSSDVKRGSVKRQSDIMREARKSRQEKQEEQEEERKRKQSYYRRVTGQHTYLLATCKLSNAVLNEEK